MVTTVKPVQIRSPGSNLPLSLRSGLPPGFALSSDPLSTSRSTATVLSQGLAELAALLVSEAGRSVVAACMEDLAVEFMQDRLPPSQESLIDPGPPPKLSSRVCSRGKVCRAIVPSPMHLHAGSVATDPRFIS